MKIDPEFTHIQRIFDKKNNQYAYRVQPGEYFVIAGIPGEGVNEKEYELLGGWYIPVMLLGMVVFYILVTLILRLEKYLRINKEMKIGYNIA